jgi:adenosine deaminase
MQDLVALPKAELHIHLEGSMRVRTIRELAERRGVAPPSALGADDVWRFDGPEHFIDQYGDVCNVLQEPDEFRRVGVELCEDLAAQGVRYTRVAWATGSHRSRRCSTGSRPANGTPAW